MGQNKSILFVSSEVTPFVKTGGLADVSAGLPLALVEMGYDIRIITPKYGNVSERRNRIHEIKRLKDIPIEVAGEESMATVKSSQVINSKSKVQVYLVTSEKYFEPNKGAYVSVKTGKEFPNNDERFIFFQKAAIETCFRLGWKPDYIHCNDWQTGLIPVFLKELYADSGFFDNTRSIFTVHNLAYQGVFPKESFEKTGLPKGLFKASGVAHKSQLNMMKAGLLYADAVTTVSPTYAAETAKKEHGEGLESVVRKISDKYTGILNGIDTDIWNPRTDRTIDETFSADDLEEKFDNKKVLLKKFGVKADRSRPAVVMIARMVEQKGYDLVLSSLKQIAKLDLDLIIMGEGSGTIPKDLEKKTAKVKNVHLHLGYDENLAHLFFAGADILLMPSKYEPCGLNQLYAKRYGTVPVARGTGGILDSVIPFTGESDAGEGFLFEEFSADSMLGALEQALEAYSDSEVWQGLQARAMQADHSWTASAERYVEEAYASS